eukprot:TRINITY_DN11900_c0_g1_i3.p1 TRINITY_DN11900_c0_g1~~TRINITY_DN11900_c0_g1_i3.p1  ORF type:complete len:386 (-),score=139.20 TRINITY_DN11900_c0_g1_i3:39-1196(-)
MDPAVSLDRFAVCNLHRGGELSYCKTCKAMLCSDCSAAHVKAYHVIRGGAQFAEKLAVRISKYRSSIINTASDKIECLVNYQKELDGKMQKSLNDFQESTNACLKIMLEKFCYNKENISKEITHVIQEIEQASVCEDFDEEARVKEIILRNESFLEIGGISKEIMERKYKVKLDQINKLVETVNKFTTNGKNFIKDCDKMKDMIFILTETAPQKLLDIYEKRLASIKKCSIKLREKNQEVAKIKELTNQLKEELKLAAKEKADLRDSVGRLKETEAELQTSIEQLQRRIEELRKSIKVLDVKLAEQKSEADLLDIIIKKKEVLNENASASIRGSCEIDFIEGLNFQEKELLSQASIVYILSYKAFNIGIYPVSYTHLTLPTICSV